MKTSLYLTLAAAVVAALTLNVSAYETAQSPRAAANQIKVVKSSDAEMGVSTVEYVVPSTVALMSPRTAVNQSKIIKGTASENSVKVAHCQAIGSPKYQALMGTAARSSCCGLTLAQCPTTDVCQK